MQHPLWEQGACQPQCPWVKAKTERTASLRRRGKGEEGWLPPKASHNPHSSLPSGQPQT